jgi:alpha,alpha-trehalose phosphorylase
MRDQHGTLSFTPRLPEQLSRLALKISLRQRRLALDVRAATATYTLLDGEPLRLTHHGQPITVTLNHPIVRPIPPAPAELPRPTQPPGREPVRAHPTERNSV